MTTTIVPAPAPVVKKAKPRVKKAPKIVFDYKQLSKDILAKRVKDDLSFRVAAKKSGIPMHILSSVETGKQVPSCTNLALVLTWLQRTANTYFVTVAKSK